MKRKWKHFEAIARNISKDSDLAHEIRSTTMHNKVKHGKRHAQITLSDGSKAMIARSVVPSTKMMNLEKSVRIANSIRRTKSI